MLLVNSEGAGEPREACISFLVVCSGLMLPTVTSPPPF